jgi:Second Messenger Oligonucleotide or Dinucleotide Synthetase domain
MLGLDDGSLGTPFTPLPSPPANPLNSLLSPYSASTPQGGLAAQLCPLWRHVTGRFQRLLSNLCVTDLQQADAETKRAGVTACLSRRYWRDSSATLNGIPIGSWGKGTHVAPPRDVDLLFLLPVADYQRFQSRTGNRQSQLLQEVKDVLAGTYRRTSMRGDGQVVIVPFDSITVEVAPGFRCSDGSIIVCDTNNNGRYMPSTAEAEAANLSWSDIMSNGNARRLARVAKGWQAACNVPLKSFQIERLVVEFLSTYSYSREDLFYYDWMVRDFLGHLVGRAGGFLLMPGTGEVVSLGNDWLSRAQTAHKYAVRACEYERESLEVPAGQDWQRIFGTAAPLYVS